MGRFSIAEDLLSQCLCHADVLCFAWNYEGMDDGEPLPLIFSKSLRALNTDYLVRVPFAKSEIDGLWCEPELVLYVYDNKVQGVGIGNDITVVYPCSNRDHHLFANKSLTGLTPISKHIELVDNWAEWANLDRIVLGSILTPNTKVLPDRKGHSNCFKYLETLLAMTHKVNDNPCKIIFSGTVACVGTPIKLDSPLMPDDGDEYLCTVTGMQPLLNKIIYKEESNAH